MSVDTFRRKFRTGSAQVLYAIMLPLLIIPMAGLAIDGTTLYLVQEQLQTAADSAALGGTRMLGTNANISEMSTEFMNANFPASYWGAGTPVTSISVATGTSYATVNVTSTVTVPILFMRVLGISQGTVQVMGSASAYQITPCTSNFNYPYGTAPAMTSVPFDENTVLADFGPTYVYPNGKIIAWYTDEHALTLGIREVDVITAGSGSGGPKAKGPTNVTTVTDYSGSFTTYNSSTMSAISTSSPLPVGDTNLTGQQAGTDTATWQASYNYLDESRPMFPALYMTDITQNATNTSGDWQQGGMTALGPNAVYGVWKAAVRSVDTTTTPWTITVTPDSDPAKNNWTGIPDTPPGGFPSTEGYTAEVIWYFNSLPLQPGHIYRVQFLVHDGDQNKVGGDVGEGCAIVVN